MDNQRPERPCRKQLTLTPEEDALLERAAAVLDVAFTQMARSVLVPFAREVLASAAQGGAR